MKVQLIAWLIDKITRIGGDIRFEKLLITESYSRWLNSNVLRLFSDEFIVEFE